MNKSNRIKYLYHYTSIETLALILKTRKFKFNRLDNVNDPLDGITEDFPNSNKIAYVACFTARVDDSIPMWSLYTKDMLGVRIRFHHSLFGFHTSSFWGEHSRERDENPFEKEKKPLVIFGPTRVRYVKSKEIKGNTVIGSFMGGKEFYPLKIGIRKIKDWSFEKEWRFKILSFNAAIYGKDDNHLSEKMEQITDYIRDDIQCLFVDFDENAFDDIEILLGPKTNEAQKILVKSLIEKYAPKAVLRKSAKKVK